MIRFQTSDLEVIVFFEFTWIYKLDWTKGNDEKNIQTFLGRVKQKGLIVMSVCEGYLIV